MVLASSIYEEFVDYHKGNYRLHRDNDRIFVRMDALACRQELQVQREESNTQYLVSLMAYYHDSSSSLAMPLVHPPPSELPTWPPPSPPQQSDDDRSPNF